MRIIKRGTFWKGLFVLYFRNNVNYPYITIYRIYHCISIGIEIKKSVYDTEYYLIFDLLVYSISFVFKEKVKSK